MDICIFVTLFNLRILPQCDGLSTHSQ